MTNMENANITVGGDSIGSGEYSNRQDMIDVTIPEGVRCVDSTAFYGCANLTSVKFSDGLKEIGDFAFAQCESLEEITLPPSVCKIGKGAFANCVKLRKIKFPDGFRDIRPDILAGCTSVTEIEADDSYVAEDSFLCKNGRETLVLALPAAEREGVLRIPPDVKEIAADALGLCVSTTKIAINRGLEDINRETIKGLKNLTSFDIESGSRLLFHNGILKRGVTLLLYLPNAQEKSIRIEASDEELIIGRSSFCSCDDIESVEITANTRCNRLKITIQDDAFRDCRNLKTVTLPADSAVSIGDRAFQNCGNLQKVANGCAVSIGDKSFENCGQLEDSCLCDETLHLGKDAFSGCTSLKSASIPSCIDEIPEGVFADCVNIRNVDMHDDVRTIGTQAFIGCSNLISIELPINLKDVGCGAFAFSGLTSVAIPRHTERLGDYAFAMCKSLEAATMPSSFFNHAGSIFMGDNKLQVIGTNNEVK